MSDSRKERAAVARTREMRATEARFFDSCAGAIMP
eukprot:CAMPEP_0179867826 /NCGR_PEP_ID=MMETSP0982-20121206/18427_1 /TAXON_ID=483367 /ORGANISM="non described non described, Strain CCMP 2436" /LENGTH=34 /DNA_ID= /DNA_START= /DNA_END= /DNA_ORIENTATION=